MVIKIFSFFLFPGNNKMSISLLGALNVCRVDQAFANKMQSDRFINPSNMVCPTWLGTDNVGRQVCPDSFYTKNAGCNSALDRVDVENYQRPQYSEYITLSTVPIQGDLYGNIIPFSDSQNTITNIYNTQAGDGGTMSGGFGLWNNQGRNVTPMCQSGYSSGGQCCPAASNTCNTNNTNYAQARENFTNRTNQRQQVGYQAYQDKRCSGF